MSNIPKKVNTFLFSEHEEYFKVPLGYSAPCISFFTMQLIRIILFIMLLFVFALNFYINVRKSFMYLNFWALTFTFLYMLFVIPNAGRQVIERILREK